MHSPARRTEHWLAPSSIMRPEIPSPRTPQSEIFLGNRDRGYGLGLKL